MDFLADLVELCTYLAAGKLPTLVLEHFFYAFSTTVACALLHPGGVCFSRFRFPGRDFWFVVLIATIFLPVR